MKTNAKFSPDLVLKDAQVIINQVASNGHYEQYYKVAKVLMTYERRVRPLAIEAICEKFNLDISRLEKQR